MFENSRFEIVNATMHNYKDDTEDLVECVVVCPEDNLNDDYFVAWGPCGGAGGIKKYGIYSEVHNRIVTIDDIMALESVLNDMLFDELCKNYVDRNIDVEPDEYRLNNWVAEGVDPDELLGDSFKEFLLENSCLRSFKFKLSLEPFCELPAYRLVGEDKSVCKQVVYHRIAERDEPVKMFSEDYNRYVATIDAYRKHLDKGLSQSEMISQAVTKIRTENGYHRFDRLPGVMITVQNDENPIGVAVRISSEKLERRDSSYIFHTYQLWGNYDSKINGNCFALTDIQNIMYKGGVYYTNPEPYVANHDISSEVENLAADLRDEVKDGNKNVKSALDNSER